MDRGQCNCLAAAAQENTHNAAAFFLWPNCNNFILLAAVLFCSNKFKFSGNFARRQVRGAAGGGGARSQVVKVKISIQATGLHLHVECSMLDVFSWVMFTAMLTAVC